MTKTIVFAAALTLMAATAAFAQADNSQTSQSTMTMKKSQGAKDAGGMQAGASDDAAKPKAHHKMAKNEAALDAQEAEVTKQLNEQQSQYAQNAK